MIQITDLLAWAPLIKHYVKTTKNILLKEKAQKEMASGVFIDLSSDFSAK